MPYARQEVYGAIKKVCVAERGVPSQVVLVKNLIDEVNFVSVVRNLTLQINCKLGGCLWGLKVPLVRM
jgi:aubergine-like protein